MKLTPSTVNTGAAVVAVEKQAAMQEYQKEISDIANANSLSIIKDTAKYTLPLGALVGYLARPGVEQVYNSIVSVLSDPANSEAVKTGICIAALAGVIGWITSGKGESVGDKTARYITQKAEDLIDTHKPEDYQ